MSQVYPSMWLSSRESPQRAKGLDSTPGIRVPWVPGTLVLLSIEWDLRIRLKLNRVMITEGLFTIFQVNNRLKKYFSEISGFGLFGRLWTVLDYYDHFGQNLCNDPKRKFFEKCFFRTPCKTPQKGSGSKGASVEWKYEMVSQRWVRYEQWSPCYLHFSGSWTSATLCLGGNCVKLDLR